MHDKYLTFVNYASGIGLFGMENLFCMKLRYFVIVCIFILLTGCVNSSDESSGASYVKPSIDYNGRFRKGHIRMPVSTDKDAIKNRNRSKYYYETRGKYKRRNR